MVYNLNNLWQRATNDGPIPLSTAILALAMEMRGLRQVLQQSESPRTFRMWTEDLPD